MDRFSFLFNTFSFNVGSLRISPNYMTAGLIVILIFVLILSVARMHRLFIDWSFRGAIVGVALGFILALVIEGFFIINGSTVLVSLLGWENAPKPVSKLLDESRVKLEANICKE